MTHALTYLFWLIASVTGAPDLACDPVAGPTEVCAPAPPPPEEDSTTGRVLTRPHDRRISNGF